MLRRNDVQKNENKYKQVIINSIYIIAIFSFLFALAYKDMVSQVLSGRAEKYYMEGNFEKALNNYNLLLQSNNEDYDLLYNKGSTLIYLGRYEEAIDTFRQAEKINSLDEDLYTELGYAYYNLDNIDDSIVAYNNAFKINPKNVEAISWIAFNNTLLKNYDEALALSDKAIEIDDNFSLAYNVKGTVYKHKGDYKQALKYFDLAIEKDSDIVDVYVSKLEVLYFQRSYMEALDFAIETNKLFPKESEILYYLGDIYSEIGEVENSIKNYEEALKLDPENPELAARLGMEYYYNQDFQKAASFADKSLGKDTTNKTALFIKDSIKFEERPEAEKVVEFVKKNYLYLNEVKDFDKKSNEFISKGNVTNEDIRKYLESIKVKKDPFTFIINDSVYDDFMQYESYDHLDSMMLDGKTLYIKITSFAPRIDTEFRDILTKVENTENKNLVIDLRDNGGGLGIQANNILDLLLPESTASYLINRDGDKIDYYSGESYSKFNKIFLLVNGHSASSSELLALGLKKHLNNVTIVGQPTFGKGVGQVSYENKSRRYSIFLVNFYWNVKDKNIVNDKIYPDVPVYSEKYEDYIKVVNDIINQSS